MIQKKLTGIIFLLIALSSCDPGHHGKAYINNSSSYTLRVSYSTHAADTVLFIAPGARVEAMDFGGLGAGNDFDCCTCRFLGITIEPTDTSKHVTKNPADKNNWTLTNPNSKRRHHKEINCEFTISPQDIQ